LDGAMQGHENLSPHELGVTQRFSKKSVEWGWFRPLITETRSNIGNF
jgi:hypothetical protein